jgi:dopamine beta-monooxygenase
MLEVHFNNEKLQSDVKDNSGMKFVVTQNLRSHDSGIMELGLVYTDKMAIPPGQNSFALHGYCLPQCSAVVSTGGPWLVRSPVKCGLQTAQNSTK